MDKIMNGKVWRFGDNINTDLIFPSQYLYESQDPYLLAQCAMEPLIKDFYKVIEPGDFIVGGENFGCGSSREQAVTSLKYAGVGGVIAKSFSRIFFRNSIAHGLPSACCPEFVDKVQNGDYITIDWAENTIVFNGNVYSFAPLGAHVRGILEKGGLLPYLKERFKNSN